MYPNGEVPTSLLAQRPSAGKDPCLMMPGTAAKHDRLVQLGAAYGWVPLVSGPADAYRTVGVQEDYWAKMPSGQAAYPGTSSHGGTYDFGDGEVEQGAVDYGNWSDIGWDLFCELTRAVGFVPGVFVGRPGIPDEYWHVFDPTPWTAPPAPTVLDRIFQEDTMSPIVNVVPKYGIDSSGGTIYIGRDDGTFEPLDGPPYPVNVRGIIGVAFLGSTDGTKDIIPTVSAADFEAVKKVWAQMRRGRLDAKTVWSTGLQAQDEQGLPLYLQADGTTSTTPTGKPLMFSAGGYIASTNAGVNKLREEIDPKV